MSDIAPVPSGRRYDLDWIRVGAFLLLILYHVGMFYVPWEWHVKSGYELPWLMPVMQLTSPWRLTLLFLVSGCATRFLAVSFAARGKGVGALAGSRVLRLLPPLLFGMFVIVPPQSYYEIFEHLRDAGVADPSAHPALTGFWLRYTTASGGWCEAGDCLVTPTWNHLWFVAYLLVYSLLLAFILAVPGGRRVLQAGADRAFRGWGLIVWPLVWLIAARWLLAPAFEVTHALVDDWYNHALSFGAFLFGFLIARSEPARQTFMAARWPALVVAVASWTAWGAYVWTYETAVAPEALRLGMRVVYAVDQWAFIVAILGFGARWLNRGGPVLRYLTIGVFPFYIVHQTVTVVVGHHLAAQGLPLAAEAGLLIAVTFAGCFLAYEIARRIGWLGLLLGVRPAPAVRPRTVRLAPHRPASPG